MEVDRRYQVFVSSTFTDLVAERQEVIQALLELDLMAYRREADWRHDVMASPSLQMTLATVADPLTMTTASLNAPATARRTSR
jgi:hypothetical protein